MKLFRKLLDLVLIVLAYLVLGLGLLALAVVLIVVYPLLLVFSKIEDILDRKL